jgi:hypothetical protein
MSPIHESPRRAARSRPARETEVPERVEIAGRNYDVAAAFQEADCVVCHRTRRVTVSVFSHPRDWSAIIARSVRRAEMALCRTMPVRAIASDEPAQRLSA